MVSVGSLHGCRIGLGCRGSRAFRSLLFRIYGGWLQRISVKLANGLSEEKSICFAEQDCILSSKRRSLASAPVKPPQLQNQSV